MNEIKTIQIERKVGDDYFMLKNDNKSKLYLIDFVSLFNIDDYNIIKATNNQRVVSKEEFLDFNNAKYILYKKDKYSLEFIKEWINRINEIDGVWFLDKPLPPFSPNKIIIK